MLQRVLMHRSFASLRMTTQFCSSHLYLYNGLTLADFEVYRGAGGHFLAGGGGLGDDHARGAWLGDGG